MFTDKIRGRITSDAVDENRFLLYSPEWYFARYCDLMKTDLTLDTPVKFGLTLADALAYVDQSFGWNGTLEGLKFDWALAAHRAMHWSFSNLGVVFGFSPVSVDILMIFKQAFGDEVVGDLVDRKIRQLNYFRGLGESKGDLSEVVAGVTKALSVVNAAVLFHHIVYNAVIDRAIELKADAQLLNRLVLAKNTSDAVVRSYTAN